MKNQTTNRCCFIMTYHDFQNFFYLVLFGGFLYPAAAWVKGFSLVSSLVGPRGVAMIPRCRAKAWLTWHQLDANRNCKFLPLEFRQFSPYFHMSYAFSRGPGFAQCTYIDLCLFGRFFNVFQVPKSAGCIGLTKAQPEILCRRTVGPTTHV